MNKAVFFLVGFLAAATAHAGTAYFKYERETGMTKQCVYDYLGSEYTITISSIKLCPLSIQV